MVRSAIRKSTPWVGYFLAFAIAITAAAAMVAYEANDTMVANAPVSHVVAR